MLHHKTFHAALCPSNTQEHTYSTYNINYRLRSFKGSFHKVRVSYISPHKQHTKYSLRLPKQHRPPSTRYTLNTHTDTGVSIPVNTPCNLVGIIGQQCDRVISYTQIRVSVCGMMSSNR